MSNDPQIQAEKMVDRLIDLGYLDKTMREEFINKALKVIKKSESKPKS